MFVLRGLCFAVILIKIRATLHICDNHNGYLEIEEGKKNNIFTESGVSLDLTVQWKQKFPGYNPYDLGECPGGSYLCTSKLDQIFTFSRTVNTVSVIVNEPGTNNKQIFWTMNLLSLTFSGSTKLDENSCPLDLINPPVGASCTVQFSVTTWAVTGFCNVTQVLSKRGRYYCLVYQVNEESSSAQSLVGNFTMITSKNGNTEYVDGYCQINSTLPPAGKYNYSIVIVPGNGQVSPSFSGSNEIKLPRSPFHNCSQNVIEGQTLRCSCSVREPGFPPGFPVWNGTASSELLLSNVNRTYNERVYSCTVMWNNTAIEQENYTLTVNYPSSVLSFQIDSKESQTLNVTENSSVSVICRADGRPLPTISLLKKSNDNQPEEVAVARNSEELRYSLSVTSCETAGDYLCKSNNIMGFNQKESLINVLCAPRRRTNDSYIATFKDQEAKLSFEMITYPPPDSLSIFDKTLNITIYRNDEKKNLAEYSCVIEKLYMVFCTLTLHNQTVFHAGYYDAAFKNSQGNVTFMFEIKEETDLSTQLPVTAGTSRQDITGPVAGGIVGGVVAITVVTVVVIFVIRRKGARKKHDKGSSPPITPVDEDLGNQQNDEAEPTMEMYAAVDKKATKQTANTTTMDVYAAVDKKGTERKTTDSLAPTVFPTQGHVIDDNKEKQKPKKTAGKGKKKGKGDKKLLATEDAGLGAGALSMSPMTGSEYENYGFDKNEQGKERKGAAEIKRRNQQGLNYTTVQFDNTPSTPTPPPVLEPTEYAEIVPRQKPIN